MDFALVIVTGVGVAVNLGVGVFIALNFWKYARTERTSNDIKTVEMLVRYNEYVTDNAAAIAGVLYNVDEDNEEEDRLRSQFLEKTEGIAVLYNNGSLNKKTVNTFIGEFLRQTYEEPLKAVISKIQKDDPQAYCETRTMCESMYSFS